MPKSNSNSLGWSLQIMRAWRRKSQLQVSRKAGLGSSFISQVESGDRNPSLDSLHKIAQVLGTSTGEILRLAGQLSEGTWRPV